MNSGESILCAPARSILERERAEFLHFSLTSFFEVHLVFVHSPSCILVEAISAILLKNLVENYPTLL